MSAEIQIDMTEEMIESILTILSAQLDPCSAEFLEELTGKSSMDEVYTQLGKATLNEMMLVCIKTALNKEN